MAFWSRRGLVGRSGEALGFQLLKTGPVSLFLLPVKPDVDLSATLKQHLCHASCLSVPVAMMSAIEHSLRHRAQGKRVIQNAHKVTWGLDLGDRGNKELK